MENTTPSLWRKELLGLIYITISLLDKIAFLFIFRASTKDALSIWTVLTKGFQENIV